MLSLIWISTDWWIVVHSEPLADLSLNLFRCHRLFIGRLRVRHEFRTGRKRHAGSTLIVVRQALVHPRMLFSRSYATYKSSAFTNSITYRPAVGILALQDFVGSEEIVVRVLRGLKLGLRFDRCLLPEQCRSPYFERTRIAHETTICLTDDPDSDGR